MNEEKQSEVKRSEVKQNEMKRNEVKRSEVKLFLKYAFHQSIYFTVYITVLPFRLPTWVEQSKDTLPTCIHLHVYSQVSVTDTLSILTINYGTIFV